MVAFAPVRSDSWNFGFAVLAILACLLGRVLNIVPIRYVRILSWFQLAFQPWSRRSYLANFRRKRKITPKMQFVMWFAGLRGAIAFALAMNMPNVEALPQRPSWDNDVIVTTTLISTPRPWLMFYILIRAWLL